MAYSELTIVAESNRGHVNNVKLAEYLDQARKDWYHYCILLGVEAVVVHIGVDYKKEVFNNEKLMIHTCIERVGNTSFTLQQTILNNQKELMVSAEVVLTTINRQTRGKVTVPDEVRKLLRTNAVLNNEILVKGNGID